jgi:hypothetical protein
MGQKEDKKIKEILGNMPENQRLFRINPGFGWTGNKIKKSGQFLVIENPRPLLAAPTGWFDLNGWTTIPITKEMIGMNIAVMTGIEIKMTGKRSDEQIKLADCLKRMGGIYQLIQD